MVVPGNRLTSLDSVPPHSSSSSAFLPHRCEYAETTYRLPANTPKPTPFFKKFWPPAGTSRLGVEWPWPAVCCRTPTSLRPPIVVDVPRRCIVFPRATRRVPPQSEMSVVSGVLPTAPSSRPPPSLWMCRNPASTYDATSPAVGSANAYRLPASDASRHAPVGSKADIGFFHRRSLDVMYFFGPRARLSSSVTLRVQLASGLNAHEFKASLNRIGLI
ncbi:hypothetical protein B0H11DRAFT_1925917 [Mycena galericulata]|nr:hypothetical protein B0H11DRAFT_1925917 [Mycena galericulata]